MGLLTEGDKMAFGIKDEARKPEAPAAPPPSVAQAPKPTAPATPGVAAKPETKKAKVASLAEKKAAKLERLRAIQAQIREMDRKEAVQERKAENHRKMLLAGIVLDVAKTDAGLKAKIAETLKTKKAGLREDQRAAVDELLKLFA